MRMTFNAMKGVAKDILAVQSYGVTAIKRKSNTAEDDIKYENEIDNFERLASAFSMLGLVTADEVKEIRGKKYRKSDILAIKNGEAWMCACAKTVLPMPFVVTEI